MLKKINKPLFSIILLALILRLIGISHGFPFIFHPDEPTIIRSALGIRFNPNPGHFDWPHLYIYLNYFLYMVFSKFRDILVNLGLKEKFSLLFPLIWDDNLIFYYLTRCFSAILGALTVIPVYLSGRNLFGKKVGLFSALAFSIFPYHVWHSHYSLIDVPMAFFLSWALYFSTLIIQRFKMADYILSGFFVGLSASTKYNGGLAALMVPVGHFLRFFTNKRVSPNNDKIIDFRGILALILSGFAALLGFLIGTPYALFDYKTFFSKEWAKGAFWQFSNVGSVGFSEHIGKFFTELLFGVSQNLGYVVIPVYVLTLGYLVYKIIKKHLEQKDYYLMFLYIPSIFFIWYISGFKESRSHYYFIFYPFAALIFGFFINFLSDYIKRKDLKIILLTLLYLPLIFLSLINSYSYFKGDTRNYLYNWLKVNYIQGETVFYNDRKAADILKYLNIPSDKGLETINSVSSSYIVVFDPENDTDFLSGRVDSLEKQISFSNKFKLGPNIEVYRYTRK